MRPSDKMLGIDYKSQKRIINDFMKKVFPDHLKIVEWLKDHFALKVAAV